MSRSRKVLLVLIALVVLADFLPVTREQFSWWWTRAQNQSDDYLNYLGAWPEGRHVAKARLAYDQRRWAETKRAQIQQAYMMAAMASHPDAAAAAAKTRERALRQDNFLWKETTTEGTLNSYQDYLQLFPYGTHAAEAQRKIASFGPSTAPH